MAHETLDNGEHHQDVLYFIELPNNEANAATVALETLDVCRSVNACDSIHASPPGVASCLPRLSPPSSAVIVETLASGVDYDSFPVVRSGEMQDHAAEVPEAFNVVMPGLVIAPEQVDVSTVDVETSIKTDVSSELFVGLDNYVEGGRKASHLLDHMYSVICKPNCCRCGACGEEIGEAESLKELSSEPTQIGSEGTHRRRPSFKCLHCDYTAIRRQHLKQHMATHLVQKPYKCNTCDYSASQKQSLVAHALRVHLKCKPFKCDQCDYSAFRKQHVVVHMGKHMKTKPYKCDECAFETSWKEYLGVHKKNVHPPSKTFKPWCE